MKKLLAILCALLMLTTAAFAEGVTPSEAVYKNERNANPISGVIFCADPTAIEYEGRLYVYGTNDHQQSEQDTTNDYDQIRSLVCFSTDDMVNWVYHGRIETGEIAPWIMNSWAPSIVSRVEEDGLTHFYLYFSNNGTGVAVLTATSPTGPWSDPLGQPLIWQGMPGLENCPAPFDPGVCIDENGVGWLAFGGGAPNDGTVHSYVPKIVKLGADMLSFDSEFVSIDAPLFFEASELNYIDGTYYYSYSTDWADRSGWDIDGIAAPPNCSMGYMTSATPLDADSWQYRGAFLYNSGQNAEGNSGLRWGNNHTHIHEYQGVNYVIHHTMLLEELQGGNAGFRSIMVDYLPMDTETGEIPITAASRSGVKQTKLVDAYQQQPGALMFTSADVFYTAGTNPNPVTTADGAWIYVRGVDFGYGASAFAATVKGTGRIEVRLDDVTSAPVAAIDFDCADYTTVTTADVAAFDGRNHNVYFVFSGTGVELADWCFTAGETELRAAEDIASTEVKYETIVFSMQAENPGPSSNALIEVTRDGDYSLSTASFDAASELLNVGFINTDPDATYKLHVRSITFQTADGPVEVPVGVDLDPASGSANGLANGWQGAKIGTMIYGTPALGLRAEKTTVTWIGYRFALIVNGQEVPFTFLTYNVTVSGLDLD